MKQQLVPLATEFQTTLTSKSSALIPILRKWKTFEAPPPSLLNRELLSEIEAQVEIALTPAEDFEAWNEIANLIGKYPNTMSAASIKRHAKDWVEDLRPFPLFAIKLACREYRHSAEKFAPATIGALLPSIIKHQMPLVSLRLKINHARRHIALIGRKGTS